MGGGLGKIDFIGEIKDRINIHDDASIQIPEFSPEVEAWKGGLVQRDFLGLSRA